ncbi:hypothetical protein NDU88_001473 [Pleurodeles waltl]|uniref:Uncharacterized protein n=1 Tax=Pleurodeles waltl TaxID=8319 RepID=A0AAV7W0C3_PLEWA|nr:hypothetical protein NDU88_001473 [Pleurodeles waltl]
MPVEPGQNTYLGLLLGPALAAKSRAERSLLKNAGAELAVEQRPGGGDFLEAPTWGQGDQGEAWATAPLPSADVLSGRLSCRSGVARRLHGAESWTWMEAQPTLARGETQDSRKQNSKEDVPGGTLLSRRG